MKNEIRVAHSVKGYLPESFIPNTFNLVFWGHEHDCQINPVHSQSLGYFITQPGSSIATSLSEGESIEK